MMITLMEDPTQEITTESIDVIESTDELTSGTEIFENSDLVEIDTNFDESDNDGVVDIFEYSSDTENPKPIDR